MAPPPVPANVASFIQEAASGTNLPESVVAAQNYTESGYGSNDGPSSAGAMGPWQFEPSTWASNSSSPFSDASNWTISTQAYIKLMKSLLAQYKGNVRDALAAYNAGPGDLAAGYGYADSILAMAGQSNGITVGTGTSGGSSSSNNSSANAAAGLLSWPSDITGFFKDGKTFIDALLWIVNPASWLRIGAFVAGMALIALAIYGIVMNMSGGSPIPKPTPVVVPV